MPPALSGRRIVITAERKSARKLASILERMGAETLSLPCIHIEPPDDTDTLRRSISELSSFDWLIITSRNGVESLSRTVSELGLEPRIGAPDLRVAAVGPETAKLVEELGLKVQVVPPVATSDHLLQTLANQNIRGSALLLLQGNLAQDELLAGLTELGGRPKKVIAYKTVEYVDPAEAAKIFNDGTELSAVVLMSGSAARALEAALGSIFAGLELICIGPKTEDVARQLGAVRVTIAEPHTVDGLAAAILAKLG